MEDNKYYKLLPIPVLFLGLNDRAIEHLFIFGDWTSLENLNLKKSNISDYNLLFIKWPESKEYELCGIVLFDAILPTAVYKYIKTPLTDKMPLYKYKMKNQDNDKEVLWYYEVLDNKQSLLYKDLSLLCLTTDHINKSYEWTDKEIELSEVLMEYLEDS